MIRERDSHRSERRRGRERERLDAIMGGQRRRGGTEEEERKELHERTEIEHGVMRAGETSERGADSSQMDREEIGKHE